MACCTGVGSTIKTDTSTVKPITAPPSVIDLTKGSHGTITVKPIKK